MLSLPELGYVHDRTLTLIRMAREHSAESLAGWLLLQSGFDAPGAGTVIAGSVAGAASLCVEADSARLKEGLRHGLIDFVVAHLDEALRILKNEVRRGTAVSVGLGGDPGETLSAMLERGVQPDLLSIPEADRSGARDEFAGRGASVVSEEAWVADNTSLLLWSVRANAPRSMPRIAEIAATVLEEGRPDTPARRRWLTGAPRCLGRAFGIRQCLRMTESEIAAFVPGVQSEISGVEITRDGQTDHGSRSR